MEAEFTDCSLISSAIGRISSDHTWRQLRKLGIPDGKLQKMRETFRQIQAFVRSVRHQVLTEKGNTKLFLLLNQCRKKLTNFSFYVENCIDEYESEILMKKKRLLHETFIFKLKIFSQMNQLQKLGSRIGYEIFERNQVLKLDNHNSERLEDEESIMIIERKADEEKIISMLTNNRNAGAHDIFTIAVVGMAGIGKTILADRILENPLIQNEFLIFKVKVQVFDVTRIMKEMLHSLQQGMHQNINGYEDIMSKLLSFINDIKTLIVLDDVCSVTQDQLSPLYMMQNAGCKISILVTTRRLEAAKAIGASHIHYLQKLSDDDSSYLFELVAFRGMSTEEVGKLKDVSKTIVNKCHGVPSVIQKMAGFLQDKVNVSEWTTVAETELWDLPNFEIFSTLSQTFDRFPDALKRCFAYCCIFSKGATIRKSDLVRLWLAQGFLSETTIKPSLETAEKYFDILLNESLLQESKFDEDGYDVDCTMYDLTYEMAMNFSRHELLKINDHINRPSTLSDVRHLVISTSNVIEALKVNTSQGIRLRTIHSTVAVPRNLLSQARYVYVLKLDGIHLKEVPKNIGKLKFLRYLDLSNNPFTYLPESISHLNLLQTLLLKNCTNLILPEWFPNLTSLSYIDVRPLKLQSHMVPPTALTKQPPIELDKEGGFEQFSGLCHLSDIAGPLVISGLENLKGKESVEEEKIGSKHGISALELRWNTNRIEGGTDSEQQNDDNQHEIVLERLQPHSSIRRLNLVGYNGPQFPEWVMRMKGTNNERLNTVVKIELVDCKRCLELPTMGLLLCLRELIIDGMDSIEVIGHEFYKYSDDDEENKIPKVFFPALSRLELHNCSRLREWMPAPTSTTMGIQFCRAFPILEALEVVNCPNLRSIPTAFPLIKNILIQGVERGNWLETLITNSCRNHSSLISLVLSKVSELNRLPNELFHCTSLKELSLQKCEHFRSWPSLPWNLISLEKLCIDDCPSLNYPPPVDGLISLNVLIIRGCKLLAETPRMLGTCTSLTKLSISNCAILKCFSDLQQLIRLEEVDILDCGKLESLPNGLEVLPSLHTLRINGFRNMSDQFPKSESLERLWIKGTQDMNNLPDQLTSLPSLKNLRIMSFSALEIVPDWLCDLKNLEILIFKDCEKLKQFPPRQKMLQLKKLRSLRIENCVNLEERLEKTLKANNTFHVPQIKINGRLIQGDRSSVSQEADLQGTYTAKNLYEELCLGIYDGIWPIPDNADRGTELVVRNQIKEPDAGLVILKIDPPRDQIQTP
ncbi:unnamed protein product [Amaranthus hypochondriacus]